MSHMVHQLVFYFHVTAGAFALIVFWLPMFTKKGNKNHRFYGSFFANAMYTVSISGVIMTILVLLDPVGVRMPERNLGIAEAVAMAYENRIFAAFLLTLSILVLSNTRQALLVLRAKSERNQLKTIPHLALIGLLAVTGLIIGWFGITQSILLLQIFSIVAIVNAIGMSRYIYKREIKNREWIIAHLGNIVGAGIGAYTAFFVFGGSRVFAAFLTGNLQVIPWVLPGIVGVIASVYLSQKYRQQYRVA